MSRPSIVPSFFSRAAALASVVVFVLSGTALALPPDPQNIVVIMADDLDWTELPFFNPPVRWDLDTAGVPQVAGNPSTEELRNRLPALNRMAARLYAGAASSDQRGLGQFQAQNQPEYEVKPVDFASGDQESTFFKLDTLANNDCDDPNVDPQSPGCVSRTDIYANAGGLNKIANGSNGSTYGIVFGRFYSSSAVCSPARASFMTGRHPTRIGVPRFDRPLNGTEVTIAEFLKQGCVDDGEPLCVKDPPDDGPPVVQPCECYMPSLMSSDCGGHQCTCADAACYNTGIVGKWHLGLKTKQHWAPWQQGFDEFIGIASGHRAQFNRRDLRCSPGMRKDTWKCYDDIAEDFVAGTGTECSGVPETACGQDKTCRADTDKYGLYVGTAANPPTNQCEKGGVPPAKDDVDCCAPKGWKGGRYRFKDKSEFYDANGFVAGRDRRSSQGSHFPCNDVGEVKSTQCLYATRWIRDYARNFIDRHAADAPPNGTGTKPFFLFVGFTAPHVPYSAPFRTMEHYRAPRGTLDEARIRAPSGKATYWAMLEDLDEAVGAIISKLEAVGVMSKTVVMFTSDQGRPGSLYGNPQLRGGKTNVLEGGIRVGLLIRGDGLFGRTSNLITDDTTVGSFTDMFQTIAAAAGYDDLAGTSSTTDSAFTEGPGDERIPFVKSCATPGKGCGNYENDCPGGASACLVRRLDGINLVPLFKGDPSPPMRDLVFAHYASDTHTVATVEGYFSGNPNEFATHVCAYREAVGACVDGAGQSISCIDDAPCAGTCDLTRTVRQVRAASCTVCDDQDPFSCQGVFCDVLGGVCVTTLEKADCDVQSPLLSDCNVVALPRCQKSSDCPKNKDGLSRSCMFTARVECDECVPTSWKYRGPGGKKEEALYELTSNPEEDAKDFGSDDKLDPADSRHDDADPPNGRLNCLNLADPGTSEPDKRKVYAAQQCLKVAAVSWKTCVGTLAYRTGNVPCEFAPPPDECAAAHWQGP